MIRDLTIGERVRIRLTTGHHFAGVTLEGTILSKETMPTRAPKVGRYLFPLGSQVYVLKPDVWNGTPGEHPNIRLGEYEIEELP